MTKTFIRYLFLFCCFQNIFFCVAQKNTISSIEQNFLHPPESAKPWVFWYWMHAAVSKEGITADLEAMKQAGIGGAYLMPIKDTASSIPFTPTVRQLTAEWWAMVRFAMQEAKRLHLKLAMHVSDGFALAGGPWITPELSMQKLVWTKTVITAANTTAIKLLQPLSKEGFYKDVAAYAYPINYAIDNAAPIITASTGTAAQFLADENNNETFRADKDCWIQYAYSKPITLRQIRIKKNNNTYPAQRFIIQQSNDGINFTVTDTLIPPRHGWQDGEEDYTHAIHSSTATYFRLVWQREGTEPGSEDLESAKWNPALKVKGIYLSSQPVINNYEAKNGSVWRVANATTTNEVAGTDAVPLKNIIDVTSKMDAAGNLNWIPPSGNWVIVRIGHTSTGYTNATAGAGKGLECDKFNPVAIKLQFDNWFAKAFSNTDAALAKEVLKVFHVDSWECGSQNWSSNFKNEFLKRRGYDLTPYLLVMTGVPVVDANTSEKVLHDVRQTIADLINDIFYATLKKLAHEKGCSFSAEAIAPTMVSDGLLHYKNVDVPMGEFWLNSPTHDKPNDMLDAISGAHIYGKNIVQAEAFTSLRMNWGEHPGNLKALGDRNFAFGINKMVLHVFTHNPWMDKKPGMTLDGVGLYFQRDQTWFKQSKAWIDYLTRCQALLQMGKPVVDIAVFTGEEVPRRAILPDRLVNTLPGIFGKEKVEAEKKRLENTGQPMRQIPDGVSHSANMADSENWIDPLNGYAYDSFNPDALMMMSVKNGRVVLPGGAAYKILVISADMKLNPADAISTATVKKIIQLVKEGTTVLIDTAYQTIFADNGYRFNFVAEQQLMISHLGKGRFVATPYRQNDFTALQLQRDIIITEAAPGSIAYAHRKVGEDDVYFVSNQKDAEQNMNISFRVGNKTPEIWDPVTGLLSKPNYWDNENGKINIADELQPNQSLFIVFRKKYTEPARRNRTTTKRGRILFSKEWEVQFDKNYMHIGATIILDSLASWTQIGDNDVAYYSGTAIYRNKFNATGIEKGKTAIIKFDSIYNIATIKINGIDCGTLWTQPYQLDITKALKPGENKIEIAVTNTWHNRLIGDNLLPVEKRITFTTAPFRLKDKPLLPAGIIGEVRIIIN